jgi:hypothetical protein
MAVECTDGKMVKYMMVTLSKIIVMVMVFGPDQMATIMMENLSKENVRAMANVNLAMGNTMKDLGESINSIVLDPTFMKMGCNTRENGLMVFHMV